MSSTVHGTGKEASVRGRWRWMLALLVVMLWALVSSYRYQDEIDYATFRYGIDPALEWLFKLLRYWPW